MQSFVCTADLEKVNAYIFRIDFTESILSIKILNKWDIPS
ncbi:hypothetical protein LEP1GSC202_2368 [Leptospira yanagawae serovar Saopaulo str. Sao Paulo = ATCC 700523]|uniref:Uncharacterized protein n=1 Tax=Leptospira yanagawae serovar Saopaulo str. Sao Paulo = ATCC 700523 TaxID=1249483 RepID=A0A5E8HA31_9LEPT|nr:hypothetical protein LEP1GSC202_2368 [Leptospira yanagawae serovar Saopaulo str. Sao Paulo = ATCC 700523]